MILGFKVVDMPAKWNPPDGHNICERYVAGEGAAAIGKTFGVSEIPIVRILREACIPLRPRWNWKADLPWAEARAMYEAGSSLEEVGARFGYNGVTIARGFHERGWLVRDGSAASRTFYAHATPTQRAEITKGVARQWERTRGIPLPAESARKRAQFHQESLRLCGAGEAVVGEWLRKRGLEVIPQLAVERYNIDLALGPVAVEIHWKTGSPFSSRNTGSRIKYLTHRGFHVIYIWVGKCPLRESVADDVVAFLEQASSDPSPIGKYRVIRGCGEFVTEGCDDLDQFSLIRPPRHGFKRTPHRS